MPDRGESAARLLKVASRTGRVDRASFEKTSSRCITPLLDGIVPERGRSLLHVIAVGEHAKWGPNSNADSFNKTAARVYPLDPASARHAFYDLKSGLVEKHATYEREGGLYFEHYNRTKGAKKQGTVKRSVYNDPMGRVELVIEVEDAKHGPLLSAVERGDPTFVSQGCSVPQDVCSACLNAAKSPKDYCDHMRRHKLEMLDGGGRVYCFNPDPTFHDISVVKIPAFIPAFVLGMRRGQEKAASMSGPGADLLEFTYGAGDFVKAAGLDIPATAVHSYLAQAYPARYALVEKLAKMEKEVPGNVVDAVIAGSRIPAETRERLAATVIDRSPAAVVSETKAKGQVLPGILFHDILIAERPEDAGHEEGFRKAVETVFSDLMDDPEALSDIVEGDDYKGGNGCMSSGLDEFSGILTADPKKVLERGERAMLSGDKPAARNNAEPDDGDVALAREYARYLLSALEGMPEGHIKVVAIRKGRE